MRIAALLIAPLAFLAGRAVAQAVEPEPEGPVCIGGPRWSPSLADDASIASEPVPASYRSLFESTAPCVRWALDEESLVDWHLRFGTERTVTPALAYLERDYLRGRPLPDRYLAELRIAWRGAERELRHAATMIQPEGLNYSVAYRFVTASRSIRRLRAALDTRDNYIFLAKEHLRAAEEFGSLTLLSASERYLEVVTTSATFLVPLQTGPQAAGVPTIEPHDFQTDDLEMRAAVLRARLTRSPEAISSAEAVVQAKARPHYARLAELAFSGGDDFCDISDGAGDGEAMASICREDDASHERIVSYLLAGSALDLIARPGEREQFSSRSWLAQRLLSLENQLDRPGRCCRNNTSEDQLRLHLAIADKDRRQVSGTSPLPGDDDELGAWLDGLRHLREAERLAPPYRAPGRFRRIAQAWLELWDEGRAPYPPDRDRPLPSEPPDRLRYAAYLRAQLAALDAAEVRLTACFAYPVDATCVRAGQ